MYVTMFICYPHYGEVHNCNFQEACLALCHVCCWQKTIIKTTTWLEEWKEKVLCASNNTKTLIDQCIQENLHNWCKKCNNSIVDSKAEIMWSNALCTLGVTKPICNCLSRQVAAAAAVAAASQGTTITTGPTSSNTTPAVIISFLLSRCICILPLILNISENQN